MRRIKTVRERMPTNKLMLYGLLSRVSFSCKKFSFIGSDWSRFTVLRSLTVDTDGE